VFPPGPRSARSGDPGFQGGRLPGIQKGNQHD